MLIQKVAFPRQNQMVCPPDEQFASQFLLQQPDLFADSRLCNDYSIGGVCNASAFHNSPEILQLNEVHDILPPVFS